MKIFIIWILCGMIGLPLLVKYGTRDEISKGVAIFTVLSGPAALLVGIAVFVFNNDITTGCAFRCKDSK